MKTTAIFIQILIFIYSFSMFWVGYHNMDNAHNLLRFDLLCEEKNETFKEMTLNYKIVDPTRAYIIGIRQMFIGFYICFFSAFFLGRAMQRSAYNSNITQVKGKFKNKRSS